MLNLDQQKKEKYIPRRKLYEAGEPFGESATKQKPDGKRIYGAGVGVGTGTCFTDKSMVTMSDGSLKKICDVQVGDYVFNHNKTSINKVKLVEKVQDTYWGELYTPTDQYAPFATTNHPLYINGVLSAVNPDECFKMYPWLGKTVKLEPTQVIETSGEYVYNLWLDGDGTYIINGYGTTSIFGDGGLFRQLVDQELLSAEEAINMLHGFASNIDSHVSPSLMYGGRIVAGLVEKLNSRAFYQFILKRRIGKGKPRLPVILLIKLIGSIAIMFDKLKGK